MTDNLSDSAAGAGSGQPSDRVLLGVDLCEYSTMNVRQMNAAQEALSRAHETAVAVSADTLGVQELGDGFLAQWISHRVNDVLAKYVPAFCDSLAEESLKRGFDRPLRVRLAVVTGLVADSAMGIAGRAAVEAQRLVNCAQAKRVQQVLTEQPVVLIISRHVFEQTIQQRWTDIEPGDFTPVDVRAKHEQTYKAWIGMPGHSADEVARAMRPEGLLARFGRFLGRTLASRAGRAAQAVRKTPKMLVATLVPAVAVAAAAVLLSSLTSWSSGPGASREASAWATATVAPDPDRPEPSTSRSDDRPGLTPSPTTGPAATPAPATGARDTAGVRVRQRAAQAPGVIRAAPLTARVACGGFLVQRRGTVVHGYGTAVFVLGGTLVRCPLPAGALSYASAPRSHPVT
ncbi:hypothetical protein [Streptomyces lincolnensis]|uniref:hypothetical protein n=1 Tax=Streptomyces lincolnensis TaxID=1915 RepID=UPI0037D5F6BB